MVDVYHRPTLPHGLPPHPYHAAGLRRLSTRASAPSTPAPPSPSAAAPSAAAVLAHLAAAGVPVLPGLSATELALVEAALGGVQLPPDLRELLALGVPSGDDFPCYRSSAGLRLLRFAAQEVPSAVAATLPLAPGRRAGRPPPPLVPLCGRHYVPATPCLVGNPVFHVSDSGVTFAGANVADFLLRAFAAEAEPPPLRRQLSAPFWSDAAAAGDRFLEVVPTGATTTNTTAGPGPEWLRRSLEQASSALTRGGWEAGDVEEMTGPNGEANVDVALTLTVDRCCGELRRGRWGAEEVVEMLGPLLGPSRKARRAAVALPPDVAARVGRLAEAVSRAVGPRGGGRSRPPRPF
uniref:Knr4/Smi1-like domain-containing protein n=1 Tax=Aegilops tauschii subsp. strangulata TaxID=200361 RepID=A0A452ZV28_AEGTS